MGIALSDEQLRFVSQMPQISLDMYRVRGRGFGRRLVLDGLKSSAFPAPKDQPSAKDIHGN